VRGCCTQLGADRVPGDVIFGARECFASASLYFGGPGGFDIVTRLAIERGEKIRDEDSAFLYRKLHGVLK
jgi:hypothetical protein